MNGISWSEGIVPAHKGDVLVVDDNPQNLELLCEVLVSDGFAVRPVNSGHLALESAQAITPDLILLDIRMPDLDGYEVCRRLKADHQTRDVPVIFVSGLRGSAARVHAFEAGGVSFISRPFQVAEVLAQVRTHLALRKVQIRVEMQKERLEKEIKDRKKAEQVLRESEELLKTILDNTPTVIYLKDAEGRYILVNRKFEEIFHLQREKFLGKSDYDIMSKYDAELVRENDRIVTRSGKAIQVEESVRHDDGLHSYISVKFPLLNVYGEAYAVCGISSDITERKKAELVLQHTKEAAEAANRAKSIFLANMSHELRTPLNLILGFSQLMQRDVALSLSSRDKLDTINRSGEHLLRLINDVLEVSKIEAGHVTLNHAPFDFHGVLWEIEAMFGMRAQHKGLFFSVEKTRELPQYLMGDEGKLRQVLINLLGNAVKFTDQGSVTLRVSSGSGLLPNIQEGGLSRWSFSFEVKDTGAGIAAGEMSKLFKPFEQTFSGQTKGGTGLGLAISRQYASLMGGDLTAKSTPGQGSEFTFSCWFEECREGVVKKAEAVRRVVGLAADAGPKSVLVVDDKEESRLFLAELLSLVGFATWEAANGKEALEVFSSKKPDLVLMDMRMPVMDGYTATRRLKAMPTGKNTPVIAVSASALMEERSKVLATGADDFICKPFRESDLFEAIGRLLDVEYRYADENGVSTGSKEPAMLTPADLAGLPEGLCSDLRKALLALNVNAIRGAIDHICTHNQPLGEAMRRLERTYQFEVLLRLMKE